jgi:hypothetical protein
MINTNMEMRKLLNILKENRGGYTNDQISELASEAADDAINAAAHRVQTALGIESGDYAGIYFSSDESRGAIYDVIKDYIESEIQNRYPEDEAEGDFFDPEDDTTA